MRTVAHPTPQGASCDGVTIPSAARARIMIDRIPAIAGSIITRVRIRTQGVRRSATASTSMVHRHETKRSPVATLQRHSALRSHRRRVPAVSLRQGGGWHRSTRARTQCARPVSQPAASIPSQHNRSRAETEHDKRSLHAGRLLDVVPEAMSECPQRRTPS